MCSQEHIIEYSTLMYEAAGLEDALENPIHFTGLMEKKHYILVVPALVVFV